MKQSITLTATFCAGLALAGAALAADDMAGMKMNAAATGAGAPNDAVLTDAVVRKVNASTGMVTLQHGELKNIGMSPMTMAYKAKDAAMVKQAKEGEKVKVRVENVNGTPTIVTLLKQ
ncbi:copper-binding protein [Burkholderia sp. Ac-20379]|uniref:copper-binding protein n=1 Tax=Burkholderia sp. Ac-20379 TaxID=2703900 RepID=UPI001982437D|nr:copper-binding protein [Burkholderia sp. Ac-20379]MBN3726551.1 copper-binding protein [Burkholderia sp. Ac-20379]